MGNDVVNHPSHYATGWSNGAEVIDITENLNFNRGNCVKYVARAGKKNPDKELEDLQKAQWYLNREVARVIEARNRDGLASAEKARAVSAALGGNIVTNVSESAFGEALKDAALAMQASPWLQGLR